MNLLEKNGVRLRALEPSDVEILYQWENDPAVWGVSHTLLPFSRHTLERSGSLPNRPTISITRAKLAL